MEENKDKVSYLRNLVKELILHYIRNNLKNEANVELEIERINSIFDITPINFETKVIGIGVAGCANNDGVTIFFKNKNSISRDELNSKLSTMIHEFYHKICKIIKKDECIFLEEGYVTEITAETIRYAIDNPIPIENLQKEDVVNILLKQDLINGYFNESEFVRSTQVILNGFGYNGMLEYVFSGDSSKRIYDIAKKISSEFSKVIYYQHFKQISTKNSNQEKEVLKKLFEGVDFSKISETDIEMNPLLQSYLVEKGIIFENKRLYEMVSKYNKKEIEYNIFYKKYGNLSDDEIMEKIESEGVQFNFEYENTDDKRKFANVLIEIDKKLKSKSLIKTKGSGFVFAAKAIAYDIYKRNIKNPSDEEIKEYLRYVTHNTINEEILLYMVKNEIDSVYKKCKEGKNLSEILNESINNQILFDIKLNKIKDEITEENFWNKLEDAADIMAKQKEKGEKTFFISFEYWIFQMTEKGISTEKTYTKKDLLEYREKMNNILKKADVPLEFMEKIGDSSDKLWIEAISKKTNEKNKKEQTIALLKVANEKMNLGYATSDLSDFIFNIYSVYEDLVVNQEREQLSHFGELFLGAYYTTLKNTLMKEKRTSKEGSLYINFVENTVTLEMVEQIIVLYSSPNEVKKAVIKYPEVINIIENSKWFWGIILEEELPEQIQKSLFENKPVTIDKIKKALINDVYKNGEDLMVKKAENLGDKSKLYIIINKYFALKEQGKSEEAEELWKRFYKNEKEDKIEEESKDLLDKTIKLIENSPNEVNNESISRLTGEMRREYLKNKEKTNREI